MSAAGPQTLIDGPFGRIAVLRTGAPPAACRLRRSGSVPRRGRAGADHYPEFQAWGPPAEFRATGPAAVLVGIVARDAPTLLSGRGGRRTLRRHAGQISFPGGAIDSDDSSAEEVAAPRREAEEEVGLLPPLRRAGRPPRIPIAGTGFHILPIVARIDPDHRLFVLNAEEVEAAFEVPLGLPDVAGEPSASAAGRNGVRHFYYEMPFGEHYIWGITAGIIHGLYERLFPVNAAFHRRSR